MVNLTAYITIIILLCWFIVSGLLLLRRTRAKTLSFQEARAVQQLRPLAAFTRVAVNPESGRTLYATEDIPAFTVLGLYDGKHTKPALFVKKEKRLKGLPKYHWSLLDGTIVDPTEEDGTVPDDTVYRSALLNEPSPGNPVNIIPLTTRNNVWLFTAREIQNGEELFINYGPLYQRDYESEMKETAGRVLLDSEQVDALVRITQERPYLREAVKAFLPDDFPLGHTRLKVNSRGYQDMSKILAFCFSILAICIFACSYVTESEREESWQQIQQGATVVDVRSEQEFAEGHFAGALHMPYKSIATLLPQQIPDRDTPIVVYCTVGGRSGIAQKSLRELGYTRVFNAGGLKDLKRAAAATQ